MHVPGSIPFEKDQGKFSLPVPCSFVSAAYIVLKTDDNAIQTFMSKAREDGIVNGERYARTLKYDRDENLIKNHWERKGKAT